MSFVLNADLPRGVRGVVLNDSDRRVHVISLPREDSPTDLALIIAEEMEHALQAEGGFPSLAPEALGTEYLAAVMNSMLCDPVAHARMRKFGLDYSGILEEEQRRSMAELDGQAEPPGRLSRFWWMANYAANVLDCREVGVEDVFSPWFDARYPITAERAKGLVKRVRSLGFATPEQQVRVWRTVIERYDLEGEVRIVRMGERRPHP
jgi:hypothetical protein